MTSMTAISMNIHIEKELPRGESKSFSDYVLPVLTYKFGVVAVLLFGILVVSESYYRNAMRADKVLYVGGLGSLLGFSLLFRAILNANASWQRYLGQSALGTGKRSYLTITEDYAEKGVANLWHERFQWRMLKGFRERKSGFLLNMEVSQIAIAKADLKSSQQIEELRAFLNRKLSELDRKN